MSDPDIADCFLSSSYRGARARFLTACAEAGGEIRSHRHPRGGIDGEALYVDDVRFGKRDARRVIFVASGTHGIEGFCGSGIQTFLLRAGLAARLPDDVAVVFIHAVNPYGFAWSRRVNEDNVDLNRNFLDHTRRHPENSDYDALYDELNPAQLDDASVTAFVEAQQRLQRERGWEAAYRALSGGQYRHPRGLQFGGREPAWSNRVLRSIWARHANSAEVAVYIDLHSGLGPSGVGMLFQTAPGASRAAELARACWPDTIRAEPSEGDDLALVSGLIGPAFVADLPHVDCAGVVLEFGTREMVEVMMAVQADNWLEFYGDRHSEVGRGIASQMRHAFLVDDEAWRESVCRRALEVVEQGCAHLAAHQPSADTVRVRAATVADLDMLIASAQAMAHETEDKGLDSAVLRAGVTALLADRDKGQVWVLENDGQAVATLMVTYEWSEWRNGCQWWIQSVYVHPKHRRRGHYRRLHEHVLALARQNHACGVRLYVERENVTAQTTYRDLGMSETVYRIYEQNPGEGR